YDYTEKSKLIFGRTGPLWYRGIASDYKYYDKIEEEMLDKILNYYGAKQIAIGHTIVDDVITTDFGNKVILLDIHHDGNKFSGKSQGVLFEGNQEFIVDDKGNRNKIK
ncbi:MAG: metallophosphoesterase, partial [Candidatus Cloacimonadota bacterium]|nr:metallophosphoesterase [Candidatus Cloacimonadota bacterium]